MHNPSTTEAKQLLAQVRAGFILKGTTLTAWCKTAGTSAPAVRQALYGSWNGPKARALRNKVIKASGAREAA